MRESAARQLALEPWREEAHQQLMRALALSEQLGAALAQYETCRRVLADELGVEPSTATRKLYEEIRAGTIGTISLRRARSPHALPMPMTPFIGRERELEETARALADPMARLITLVGIDRQPVRKGWCAVLLLAPDMRVVGEARSGEEAVELALRLLPDIILMDVSMPEMDGLEATRQIHVQNDKIAILMVDMTCEEATVRQALEDGVQGYIAMHEFSTELVPGVRAVHAGKTYFSPSIAKILPDHRNGQPPRSKKTYKPK